MIGGGKISNLGDEERVWKEIEGELDAGPSETLPEPAVPVDVSEVSSEEGKVQIVGEVVELDEKELFLDDGTGSIRVLFEDSSMVKDLDRGSAARVFGSSPSLGEGFGLRAEIIQPLDGLDLDLYREVREETKKLENDLKDGGR
ncbi:hypothetical protein AKJ57_04820 [candidate division MSBL1 archaeon SCGC-AAA259A05]|uniref:OB domain-containing protein n=1 Tax=candidate division MSBL1 archaeon SCGC-AAA259A05 TaxID=1698259 RepID=A0A133U6M8_9EURY|nr:hypothetical protein AKJ57_04820 [candidate division MSBL1 archaeon SCGC-AAA259A05]